MKRRFIIAFISISTILLFIIIGFYMTSYITHNISMSALESELYKQTESRFKDISYFDIARLEKYRDKYYIIYYFTCPAGTPVSNVDKPVNPNEPLNFVGMCRVSPKANRQFSIENNTLVLAQTAINHLELYDRDMGINIVGGKIRKAGIKQMQIKFLNGDMLQSGVEPNGSFIMIYNPDKYFNGRAKGDIYYTQVVERFQGVDENDRVVSKVLFGYSTR